MSFVIASMILAASIILTWMSAAMTTKTDWRILRVGLWLSVPIAATHWIGW